MNTVKAFLCVVLAAIPFAGCRSNKSEAGQTYKTVAPEPGRDTEKARAYNAKGAALLEKGDLERAERELKAAVGADMFFGPAHNNLGTVYYRQKKFYLAAWEFQYAAKLMPGKAAPRNNLGLVYEAAGKYEDAAASYEEAVKLEPESLIFAANLARAYVRLNRNDDATRSLLNDIVMNDARPEWVAWARGCLALRSGKDAAAVVPEKK